jgi:hypothetical protein
MFWAIRRFILDIPYQVRSIVFRVRHGFPQEDWWNLETATAKFLAPRLRYLAEHTSGYPSFIDIDGISGDEIWTAILYKMTDGFEMMTMPDWDFLDPEAIDYAGECLDLFREYFFNLWD